MSTPQTRVFALSVHEDYACRHSGACCTAGWSIPVDGAARQVLAVDVLRPAADGACPEFEADSRLCAVHRVHGETMLPLSCYHFPRRAVVDARGTFVTLSHFCPTAASALFRRDVPLRIVDEPRAFPASRDYDALDGRDAWPPLVRPDVLFDLESFSAWEAFAVETLAKKGPVEDALVRLADAGERLRSWTAAHGPLLEWVRRVTRQDEDVRRPERPALQRYASFCSIAAYEQILTFVPDGLTAPQLPPDLTDALDTHVEPTWPVWSYPVRRYLAAKAFASWSAYQARGVRTLVAELVACELVLRVEAARGCAAGATLDERGLVEAIRRADWLLMHLVDRPALMRWLDQVENDRCQPHILRRSRRVREPR